MTQLNDIEKQDHLTAETLIDLVCTHRVHPHLSVCMFCREQYDALIEIERFVADEITEDFNDEATPYSLAAQSAEVEENSILLRQTWYLDDGHILLRVFEESENERLVAFVICDLDRMEHLRFRFSGIDQEFRPDIDGSFHIGNRDIDIEPMTVTIVT